MGEDEGRARRAAAVARFAELVAVARPALDEAALEIARAADPTLGEADLAAARVELDRLADGVRDVAGLVRRVYDEAGFAGPARDYYDPRHSSLVAVLARRVGIPITLAVVCLEVGRRAGVALAPVGMPGHFLLRPAGGAAHLDPLTGELLDLAGCEARFRTSTGAGAGVPFDPARMLPVIDERAVLVRMLANLRAIHRARGRLDDLEWVLAMRLALPGIGLEEVLELAEVHGRRGEFRVAAELLEHRARELRDEMPDDVDRLRRTARSWRARLN